MKMNGRSCTRWQNKDKPLPNEPPTINEIVYMLGRIGGFIWKEKSDGYQGVETVWQGLIKLLHLS